MSLKQGNGIRFLVIISSLVLFLLSSAFFFFSVVSSSSRSNVETNFKDDFKAEKLNIWAELQESEAREVYDFVSTSMPDLNLTRHARGRKDSFIFTIETLRPNKTSVLPYLHDDGPKPERWAKVTVSETSDHGPYMVFYMVGPLPVSTETRVLPLHYAFNSGKNYVKNPVQDFFALIDFSQALAGNLSDVTEDLLGAKLDLDDPDNPDTVMVIPRVSSIDSGGLMLWLQFFRKGFGSGARTLLPQGVYTKVDARSYNASKWTVEGVYYNGIVYDDVEDLRRAMQRADFIRTPRNLDGRWTDTEDFKSIPAGRELPPPISIQPYGPRYRLDRAQKFISWFGFEFYITTAPTTGVTLFDIRFKGQQVAYELGLQEAMAHYAGDDPMQGGLEFMDAFFGMGKNMFELLPGYDCPAYADYLDSSWNQAYEFTRLPNSICIFEYTSDHLMSRHSAQYSVTASRNTYLTVRVVSTVGNYDYTFDYIFYLDGTLEVKVRASGFIFSAFYTNNKTKEEDEYGHRIHESLSSSMHDHVINFKADMDVAGQTNDMVRMALEPFTKSYTWDQPEVETRNTMHLVEYPITEETGLDWSKNSQDFYIVYSANKKNSWGERKGYRVTSGTGLGNTIHLTILNSTTLGDAAKWAEHDVWVVRQKDTEPRSADPLNWFSPHAPIVNFTKIADHESLSHGPDSESDFNGDLVVYFNLGAHHVPHSGDIPNTLMHTSASSVMFVPHNFMDRDASRESVQGVRLQLKGSKSGGFAGEEGVSGDLRSRSSGASDVEERHSAKYFGATYEQVMELPLKEIEPDLVEDYESAELGVTDLGFNGSAAGV